MHYLKVRAAAYKTCSPDITVDNLWLPVVYASLVHSHQARRAHSQFLMDLGSKLIYAIIILIVKHVHSTHNYLAGIGESYGV